MALLLSPAWAERLEADEALPVAEIERDRPVDFEQEILPLLRRNCLACHNASQAESDLVLETPQAILKGGLEGPSVVAGKADESLLFQLAAHRRESFMPPEGNTVGARNFTPEELGLLKRWIDQGAQGSVAAGAGEIAWQPLPPGFNPIYAVAVSPHGRFVAAGRANQIFMYSVPTQQELGRLTDPDLLKAGLYQQPGVAHRDSVHSLAFSPRGDLLASGGFGTVKLWRREASARREELPKAAGTILALTVSRNGQLAAVAQAGGKIQLYDLVRGKSSRTLDGVPADVTSLALTSDGSRLVGGARDRTVRIWDIADGREVARFETPTVVTAVAISGDDRRIITGGDDPLIRIWAVPTASTPGPQQGQAPPEAPQPLKELQGHSAGIVALVPVPNHPDQFVSASLDGTARHWDAKSGNQIRSVNHGAPLCCVAVQADGRRIATASRTGTAKLWNAENGQQVAELTPDSQHRDEIANLQLAIQLARREVQNAASDLEAADKREQAEAENADKAAVDLVRAENEAKQKSEAAAMAVAEKEAAAKELAALEAELAAAQAAQQPASDQAAQQPAASVSEIQKKVQAAQQQVTKLGQSAQKASEEKRAADGSAEAARRAAQRSQEAVIRAAEELPRIEELLARRKEELRAAEEHLARVQQEAANRNAWTGELASKRIAADQAARDTQNQLEAAQAARESAHSALAKETEAVRTLLAERTQVTPAVQNALERARAQLRDADHRLGGARAVAETATARLAQLERRLTDARTAMGAAQDDKAKAELSPIVEYLSGQHAEAAQRAGEAAEQLQAATAQQIMAAETFEQARRELDSAAAAAREAAEKAQRLLRAATSAKAAADQAVAEADARSKAAAAAKMSADSALTAAQNKLKQGEDDAAKAVGQAEVENALQRQAAAEQKSAEASTALEEAKAAQGAAERAVADAQNESQQMQDAANQRVAAAQNAYRDAQRKLAQTDAAAGGLRAQAATAARSKAAADAALAHMRAPVGAVAFSNDGAQLAVIGEQGQVDFYSSATGDPMHQIRAPEGTLVAAAAISGERLLMATEDGSLVIRANLPTWTLHRKIGSAEGTDQLTNRVTALDFSPTGKRLATGGGIPSRSGELKLWDVDTGDMLRAIPDAHSDTILCARFSPNGKYLATCGADRFMKVFEVETGQLVKSFEGHTHHVLGVSWRADGRLLVTSGADNVIKVWDFDSGEQIRTIEGFEKEITAIEFLGVSDNFVISTGDGRVITRNTGGGGGPTFSGTTEFMYSVGASQDGKTVVAAGQDSVLRVWNEQGQSVVTFAPPPTGDGQPDRTAQAGGP